jgi:hypothetical protein
MPQSWPKHSPAEPEMLFEAIEGAASQQGQQTITSIGAAFEQIDSDAITDVGVGFQDSLSSVVRALEQVPSEPWTTVVRSTFSAGVLVEKEFPIFRVDDDAE